MSKLPEQTEGDQNLLLEQYKLYVEMMDRTSARRGEANKFYVTILAGLLAVLTFLEKSDLNKQQTALLLAVGVVGVALCVIWRFNILAYKELNRGKFIVINQMEQRLPFNCYECEWDILTGEKDEYRHLTSVEIALPVVLAIPYIGLIVYAIWHLIRLFFPALLPPGLPPPISPIPTP